ncbi:glycosyltransferase family 2 protein [Gaetbulibacter jejuensis]|uniref:Glycosyltransferase 2-like domain-containing protein n=1 Tax=Gaetbulibacter jejuensis TaxID=584607 RepID=A0ABP3V3W1_9FLAO
MSCLVTIIIPVFNRAHMIGTAIASLQAQSYTHWECVVVDDGSSDGTVKVLADYVAEDARIRYYTRERLPKGAPTCRNIGLQHAKGNYVIYLDSDDYLLPFCLEQRVAAFKKNPTAHFLVFPMGVQKEDVVVKQEIPEHTDYLIRFLSADLPWQTMCPIWDRNFLKALNGFAEGYPRFNDPELMIRALLQDHLDYKVFADYDYDSVFIPSVKAQAVFTTKVYKSLQLFVPDIAKLLDVKEKTHLKPYLLLYLHLWFKYFYVPLAKRGLKPSMRLLQLYRQHDILGFKQYMSLLARLLVYAVSVKVLPKAIDKLTEQRLYRPNDKDL